MSSFAPNEKVLCYHGPLLYEAKILKMESWDESNARAQGQAGLHFYVHYKGWKSTWDEWVPQSRLLKFNESNLARQKELVASQKAIIEPPTRAPTTNPTNSAGRVSGTDRRKDSRGVKRGREEDEKKPDLRLVVPDVLKVQLVDDWEAVTKNNQLVALPRVPSARQVLLDFQANLAGTASPESAQLFPELLAGLTLYFNRSLGKNLLYRFERAQYAEAKKKYEGGKEQGMAEVYGAEHLLRMIVNMPVMVKETEMDPESVKLVGDHLHELLKYMAERRDKLFLPEYDNASLPYLNIYRI